MRRLTFINNVFDDINGKWGTPARAWRELQLYMTHGPKDVTFDHNTIFNGTHDQSTIDTPQYPTTDFRFTQQHHRAQRLRRAQHRRHGNPTFAKYFNDAGHVFTEQRAGDTP